MIQLVYVSYFLFPSGLFLPMFLLCHGKRLTAFQNWTLYLIFIDRWRPWKKVDIVSKVVFQQFIYRRQDKWGLFKVRTFLKFWDLGTLVNASAVALSSMSTERQMIFFPFDLMFIMKWFRVMNLPFYFGTLLQ